jgi:ParB family chromosome partitioning protein
VEQVALLKLDELAPSKANVRVHIDPDRVRALAEDIAIRGLINPLVVRREDGGYGVVCGRMRLEAIRLLQREKPEAYQRLFARGVPCVVRELDDPEAVELSLSENLRQNTLTPEEVGKGLARLYEMGLSEEEISEKLLIDLSQVRRALSLYRRVSAFASYVAASRPGRPPAAAKRRISRSGVATLLSVLEKHERRGVIKPEEKESVLSYVTRMAEEKPLSTSELELLARRIERSPETVKSPERLQQAIEEVVRMDTVERVVALKRSLVSHIEKYAESKQISFDEALNELLELAMKSINI